MALVLNDRVQETCSAPGTGAVTLLGAVTGFQTFSSGVGNGNTCYYCIADQGGANWEVGLGTYSSSGNTLTRTTPYAGSASTPVNFSSGVQTVFVTYPSEKSVNLDAAGNVSALGTVSSGTWQGSTVGVAYGGTGVTTSTGTGSVVLSNSPALTTPDLGTPSAVNLTNGTALPLTTGVSGILPTANGGTNLSSFTSGGVVYASSTSALTTGSALTFDGTNLGIGTNSPNVRLQVGDGTGQRIAAVDAGSLTAEGGAFAIRQGGAYKSVFGTTALVDGAGTNPDLRIQSYSDNVDIRTVAAKVITLSTNATEQMRIDSSGNVGIGTSTPGQKLTVAGTVESTTGGFKFPDGTTQTTAATAGVSQAKATAIAMIFGL